MIRLKSSKTTKKWSFKKLYYWMVGHPGTRIDYWSCGKFADKIRALFHVEPKPHAATGEEWDRWHKANKRNVGYWIAEELLNNLQDIWYFPKDVYRNILRYYKNRFVDKSHYLSTKLKAGEYHEIETRMLHGLFETLVDFVEYEKAHMHMISHPGEKRVKLPNAELGLKYLDWEINLGDQSPLQSEGAKEVLELYKWWKEVRPQRPDTWEASGLAAFYDAKREDKDEDDGGFLRQEPPNVQAESSILFDVRAKIEQMYDDEDTEMMIRLIKVRERLWT